MGLEMRKSMLPFFQSLWFQRPQYSCHYIEREAWRVWKQRNRAGSRSMFWKEFWERLLACLHVERWEASWVSEGIILAKPIKLVTAVPSDFQSARIGSGLQNLDSHQGRAPTSDLAKEETKQNNHSPRASSRVRQKHGHGALLKGRTRV